MRTESKWHLKNRCARLGAALATLVVVLLPGGAEAAADDPSPPLQPVKLIFIHHSTGGNWLGDVDEYGQFDGGLGQALMANNYYVSATNYGWSVGGDAIGDRTDIGQWWDWFRGPNRDQIMNALFNENGQNIGDFLPWSRMSTDPGGENEVILFKSCFPNSHISGNPNDPPTTGDNPMRGAGNDLGWGGSRYTVGNAKGIYNDILEYFATRTDKLWVLITPPPIAPDDMYHSDEHTAAHAANARALNDWLVNDWLDGYPHDNVAVFDFYNVLTSNGGDVFTNDLGSSEGNHHRWNGTAIEHVHGHDNDFSSYGAYMDSHPTDAGGQKATAELVPLLNIAYNRFKGGSSGAPSAAFTFAPANPAPGDTVSFTDRSTGAPTTWSWDFGDGSAGSTVRNPTHVFVTAGVFTVSLTVGNSAGADTVTAEVTVTSEPLAYAYLIAGVAHAPGAAGTQWRTDIAGVNRTASAASLTFTYYSEGAPVSRTATLGPGATRRWRDVLVSLFGTAASASSSGSVKVASNQPLFLTSRTYNQTSEGSFGQYLPACTRHDALTSGTVGVLANLEKSDANRTNIGFLNLGESSCDVVVRLFGAGGGEVCDATFVTVGPDRWTQVNDIFVRCGAGHQAVAYATVEVESPEGMIWAYASVVDMDSGDPTTIPVLVQ